MNSIVCCWKTTLAVVVDAKIYYPSGLFIATTVSPSIPHEWGDNTHKMIHIHAASSRIQMCRESVETGSDNHLHALLIPFHQGRHTSPTHFFYRGEWGPFSSTLEQNHWNDRAWRWSGNGLNLKWSFSACVHCSICMQNITSRHWLLYDHVSHLLCTGPSDCVKYEANKGSTLAFSTISLSIPM